MNLVALINSRGIQGIPLNELSLILNGERTVKVQTQGNGMIMLTDNKILKCVDEYYKKPGTPNKAKKKYDNFTARCYYVHQELDIKNIQVNQCVSCHLACLSLKNSANLQRKYK